MRFFIVRWDHWLCFGRAGSMHRASAPDRHRGRGDRLGVAAVGPLVERDVEAAARVEVLDRGPRVLEGLGAALAPLAVDQLDAPVADVLGHASSFLRKLSSARSEKSSSSRMYGVRKK